MSGKMRDASVIRHRGYIALVTEHFKYSVAAGGT
jgi:hypothetical protein